MCEIIFCLYYNSYDLEVTWLISLTDHKITQLGMVKAVNQKDNFWKLYSFHNGWYLNMNIWETIINSLHINLLPCVQNLLLETSYNKKVYQLFFKCIYLMYHLLTKSTLPLYVHNNGYKKGKTSFSWGHV